MVADLSGIVDVLSSMPNQVNPPVALLVPANPYITPAEQGTFCEPWNVNVNLMLIVGKGDMALVQEQADDFVEKVLTTLKDYPITEVSPLVEIEISGLTYAGAVISITHNTTLGGH